MRTWHPVGLAAIAALLLAPPSLAIDADGDGVDDSVDNCIGQNNATQTDTDGDGCGNYCDGDYDQSGSIGAPDWNTFRACWTVHPPGVGPPDDPTCAGSDLDDNGAVGGSDFTHLRTLTFWRVPGPSSVSTDPVACP
jgi:hypothetical protein